MTEELQLPADRSRNAVYAAITPQLKALFEGEPDLIANMANCAAVLREALGFFWIGFYRVVGDELVLGPFQGPLACTRIALGRGVCGAAWQTGEVQLVPDVEQFPGHIACSSASRSELVLPVTMDGKIVAVLDIDSDALDDFSAVDIAALETILADMTAASR